jgi:hypothetical protein
MLVREAIRFKLSLRVGGETGIAGMASADVERDVEIPPLAAAKPRLSARVPDSWKAHSQSKVFGNG